MMAWLERQHAVKAHARWATPHNHITVFQQHPLYLIGALNAAEQEDALEPQRDGDDGLGHVNLMPVLVQAQLDTRFVAVDVAAIRPELRKP